MFLNQILVLKYIFFFVSGDLSWWL